MRIERLDPREWLIVSDGEDHVAICVARDDEGTLCWLRLKISDMRLSPYDNQPAGFVE